MRSVYQIVTKDLANCQSNAKTIDALNDVQRQIECPDPNNPTTEPQNRLNILVKGALQEAEAEEKIIKDALFKIYEVRAIINERRIKIKKTNTETFRRGALMKSLQTSALTLPLWIGKPGEKPPALCGAVPPDSNYVANVGDLVAALQKVEGGENWILAEVVEYNATTKLYNLEDIDEEQKEKGRFSLNKRRVIPLPLYRANPGTDPEFLYPTNCVGMNLSTCTKKVSFVLRTMQLNLDVFKFYFSHGSVSTDYLLLQRYREMPTGYSCRRVRGSL